MPSSLQSRLHPRQTGARIGAALLGLVASACGHEVDASPRTAAASATSGATTTTTGAASASALPTAVASTSASSATPGAACVAAPKCTPAPFTADKGKFRHTRHKLLAKVGDPRHRGIDAVLGPKDEQVVRAKLVYGEVDKDLEDEDVDVWVQRGCSGAWELLGEARTTGDDAKAAAPGEPEGGGRVHFVIPEDKRLGVGLHPLRVVVRGDGSSAELSLLVTDGSLALAVSDVDGTLTGTETEAFEKLLSRDPASAHPDAAAAIGALAERGYQPVYLTARPEWLVPTTRAFLRERGFPPGIVRTSLTRTGYLGDGAGEFKRVELEALRKRAPIQLAFGNMPSDAAAYAAVIPEPRWRLLYRLDDPRGRRFEAYGDLLPDLRALPACAPR